jgi:hypothetical protein
MTVGVGDKKASCAFSHVFFCDPISPVVNLRETRTWHRDLNSPSTPVSGASMIPNSAKSKLGGHKGGSGRNEPAVAAAR